jgi:hypothetical protein
MPLLNGKHGAIVDLHRAIAGGSLPTSVTVDDYEPESVGYRTRLNEALQRESIPLSLPWEPTFAKL